MITQIHISKKIIEIFAGMAKIMVDEKKNQQVRVFSKFNKIKGIQKHSGGGERVGKERKKKDKRVKVIF